MGCVTLSSKLSWVIEILDANLQHSSHETAQDRHRNRFLQKVQQHLRLLHHHIIVQCIGADELCYLQLSHMEHGPRTHPIHSAELVPEADPSGAT